MGPVVEWASSAGYEHARGRACAVALHVHLAAAADVDQAREILVLAELALTQGAIN
jgi:hypothetical protein